MHSRTRFGWLVTLMSALFLALLVTGVTLFVVSQNSGTVSSTQALATRDAQPTPTATLPPGNDWTQYHSDTAGTGVNPEQNIDASNVAGLNTDWVYDNKGSPYESTPAIVDGVIYMPSGNTLSAYDLRTGAELWTFTGVTPAHGASNASVAVDPARHLAYYGAANTYVYAVDTRTGVGVWKVQIGNPDQGAHIWDSPLLVDGNVYIGLASNADQPCVRGAVFAVNAVSGQIVWTHYTSPEGELGGGVWGSLSADADDHSIMAATGNPCTTASGATQHYSDYQQDSIIAMDWDTGKTLWTYKVLGLDNCDCDLSVGPVSYTLAGQKYIVAGDKQGIVYGLARTATGVRLAWSARIALSTYPDHGGIFQSPAYKDGLLYVAGGVPTDGSCPGAIWALHGDTGAVAWKSCTKVIVFSPGAITGDVLFVADYNGSMSAYDLKTGAILWHSALSGQVWGGTAIAHGKVVIATLKGKLYCFSLSDSG